MLTGHKFILKIMMKICARLMRTFDGVSMPMFCEKQSPHSFHIPRLVTMIFCGHTLRCRSLSLVCR